MVERKIYKLKVELVKLYVLETLGGIILREQPNQFPYMHHDNPYYYPHEYYQQIYPQHPYFQQNPFQINDQYYHPPVEQISFYPPNRPQSQQIGGMGPTYPYPTKKQNNTKKQSAPNIMSQFKANDGNYDINKMLSTAGTMVNTMNQITGMVKQVGGFFIPK